MLRSLILIILFAFMACLVGAGAIEGPQACARCGMDRTSFAHSRAIVAYSDGSSSGTCSLHCAVEEMQAAGTKRVAALQVADFNSKELVDARGATWVVGGKQNGVMTSPAKWAFGRADQAQQFVREYGGKVTPFEQVLLVVQEEVAEMARTPELE